MKDLRKYEPDRDLKGTEGAKIAPKGLREGGIKGPRLKKKKCLPTVTMRKDVRSVSLARINRELIFGKKKILMQKTHTSDSGASIFDF